MLKKLFCVVIFVQIFSPVFCGTIQINENQDRWDIVEELLIFEDESNSVTIQDILYHESQLNFKECRTAAPDFSFSKSTFWIVFEVENKNPIVNTLILELSDYFNLGKFGIYYQNELGELISQNVGSDLIKHRNKTSYLPVKYEAKQKFYLKIKAEGRPLEVPMHIWTIESFIRKSNIEYAVIYFFIGLIALLVIISILFGFLLKDKSFMYFGLFLMVAMIHQLWFSGLLDDFARNTLNIKYTLGQSLWGVLILSLLMLLRHLSRKHISGPLLIIVYFFILVGLLLVVAPFFDGGPQLLDNMRTITIVFPLLTVFFVVIEIRSLKKNENASIFMILGLFILLLGYILHSLETRGALPYHIAFEYTMQAGFLCQILFFSLSFYSRMNIVIIQKQQAEAQLKILVDNLPISILIYEKNEILYVNKEFERLFDLPENKINSINSWLENSLPDHEKRESLKALFYEPTVDPLSFVMQTKTDKLRNIEFIITRTDQISFASMSDITDKIKRAEHLKSLVEQKEILLQELCHRTVNNIQVISSMLHSKAYSFKDENIRESILDIESKIYSMALVFRYIVDSEDFSYIYLDNYLRDLVIHIRAKYSKKADILINCGDIKVLFDIALPIGRIVYELVSNSFMHSFNRPGGCIITINAELEGANIIILNISDNGIGLPDEFYLETHAGEGIQTVKDLVRHQLNGEIIFVNDGGLHCRISLRNDLSKVRL